MSSNNGQQSLVRNPRTLSNKLRAIKSKNRILKTHPRAWARAVQSRIRELESSKCEEKSRLCEEETMLCEAENMLREAESKLREAETMLCKEETMFREEETLFREAESKLRGAETMLRELESQRLCNSMRQINDSFFHATLEYYDAAYDFMKKFLPQDIQLACKIKEIQQESSVHIDDYFHHTASNVVLSVPTNTEKGYRTFILIEHQSTVDNNIPWRMMKYMQAIIERYDAQHKIKPHVAPILFYQGDGKPYNGALNVQDDIFPKSMRHTLATVNMTVVDLAIMSDDEIMNCGKVSAMMLAMKYARKSSDINKVMDKMAVALGRLPRRLQGRSLMYVSEQWGGDMDLLMQAMSKRKSLSEGKMVSLADILRAEISEQISERERAKGRAEAREEVRQKLLQAAKNLLLKGMSLREIQEVTGLSDQDVQEFGAYTLH